MARMAERKCCPHCDGAKVNKHGMEFGSQRYRCKDCGKTFTALTGTPFHRLRGKGQLLENAACMADGLSIRKTAARLGMSVDKAFRWRHKFLQFLSGQKPSALTGIVEADETRFPVSCKGQRRDLPCASKKRGGKTRDGAGAEKTTVVVAVQRGTQIVSDPVLPSAQFHLVIAPYASYLKRVSEGGTVTSYIQSLSLSYSVENADRSILGQVVPGV